MVFVDKARNGLTASPARYLTIESGFFLEIGSSFRLFIEDAVDATNWTDKTRNT